MAIEINGIPVPEGTDTISAEALQAMVTALAAGVNENKAQLAENAYLSQYNALGSVPYESADNRWRDISGIGFYYSGTANVGYPSATGILIHLRLSSATTVTWQLFIGNAGQIWTRRVTAAANFADATWVQV